MRVKSSSIYWLGCTVVLLVGVTARWPQIGQSLWYDEMTTLVQYVLQPWTKVVASRAGEYVPNNHVLHTILAKVVYGFANRVPDEVVLRLPAFLAGLLVPLAIAWPLRKSQPAMAFALAMVLTLNPWLVNFSTEARGYSLMMLLGIIATNSLFSRAIGYVIAMVLCIYTVPLAVLLIPAHGVAVGVLRGSSGRRWLVQIALILAGASLLYLPMARGLLSYYRHPYLPTVSYREFLNQLPRFAVTGSGNSRAAIYWAWPVITIVVGTVLGWSKEFLRPMLITLGIATLLGIVLPIVLNGATEARFVPWICLWFGVSVVAGFFSMPSLPGKLIGISGLLALCIFQFSVDWKPVPNQPIREGFGLADRIVPPEEPIMVLYLGARESIAIYGDQVKGHQLLAAPDAVTMRQVMAESVRTTGHLPWAIVFYEKLAFDRDHGDLDSRGLWTELVGHYHLATARLPGRVSPVAIYAPENSRDTSSH